MKIKMFVVVLCSLMVSSIAHSECIDLSDEMTVDYNYLQTAILDSTEDICFTNTFIERTGVIATPIEVINPVKITGLNIVALNGITTSLLKLTGSNITLENVTLTGNGAGTAIQVNGTGATIKNSTIFKFGDGIKVDVLGTVKLVDNIYSGIDGTHIFTVDGGSTPLDTALLGKHISDADATKVDYLKGKLNLDNCSGSIDLYKRQEDESKLYSLQKHTTANCVVESDLAVKFEGGEEQTFACGFKCDNFLEELSTQVVFIYSDVNGIARPFAPIPYKTFNELPSVISVMGTGITLPDSGSEADGDDTGAVIYTGGDETTVAATGTDDTTLADCGDNCNPLLDPTDTKTQDDGNSTIGGGSSGAAATVAAASGCGGNISNASNVTVAQIFLALIPFLAIPPLTYCRRRMK